MDRIPSLIETIKGGLQAQKIPGGTHKPKTVRVEIPLTQDSTRQTVRITGFTKAIRAYRIVSWRCFPGCFRPSPLTQIHDYDTSSSSTQIVLRLQDVKYSPLEMLEIFTDMLNEHLVESGQYNGFSIYESEFNIRTGYAQIRGQSNHYGTFKIHPSGTRTNPIMGGLGFRVLAGGGLNAISYGRALDTRDVSRQPHPENYQIFCRRLQSLSGGTPLVMPPGTTTQHETPIVTVRRDETEITEMSLMNETVTHVNPIAAGESLYFSIVPDAPFPYRNSFAENGNGSNNATPQLRPTFSIPDIYLRFEFLIDQ